MGGPDRVVKTPQRAEVGVKEQVKSEGAPKEDLHQDGWGYKDTKFQLNKDGHIELAGSRYLFSGQVLGHFRPWVEETTGLDVTDVVPKQPPAKPSPPVRHEAFIAGLETCCKRKSDADTDRIFHGHGHTCQEVYTVRFGTLERVPDLVVWPGSHEHVEAIVKLANEHNVVVIPFGGGTSVSGALECPAGEQRMIVSLDMKEMNAIKWVDRENMLVCMEAGIIGIDGKRRLEALGYTIGHEPDSMEFSSLGGWIATRASGMKKNTYGNIEDMLVRVKVVTSVGTIDRLVDVPRLSMGPDVQNVILGSEGTLGVITEAVMRMRALPETAAYGAFLFPDLETGVKFLREVARHRCAPSSVRLVDNEQFRFGHALKPVTTGAAKKFVDWVTKQYVTKWKGFEPMQMAAVTMLMEGTHAEVAAQRKKLTSLAMPLGALNAGAENGERGYFLTFVIAYIRDFGLDFRYMAESFETTVPWSNVVMACHRVKARVAQACKEEGVQGEPFLSCRVTQTYDTGACIYFYFGFSWKGLKDPKKTFTTVEDQAREEILACGGSLSHHHGIGKHRQPWYPEHISKAGVKMIAGIKTAVDPKNIFGNGNLVTLAPPPREMSRL